MTNVIQTFAESGVNPVAIMLLDTGAGSALELETSATLVATGPGTVQRAGFVILQALNMANLTPFHTNSNTANQNLAMGINKIVDGITIAAAYDGINSSNSWVGMDNTQVALIGTNGNNPTGYENTDADETPASINVTTLITNIQRGGVAASWRGASNP